MKCKWIRKGYCQKYHYKCLGICSEYGIVVNIRGGYVYRMENI